MNVFIITDLEGISGIEHMSQVSDTTAQPYRFSLERLMADTNAAIAGAFDGGAAAVYIEDGHGGGANFIDGMLDPRAVQVKNMSSEYLDIQKIGLCMSVGAHAMSGTLNAFLDHTQSSVAWHDYSINGRRCGELAQSAAFTGAYGIPMVMVSGDEAACAEAKQFFGDIAVAVVKYAAGRNTAKAVDLNEAERRIYEAAKTGMALAGRIKPFCPLLPAEIKLEYNRADYCDSAMARANSIERLERLDSRTVRKVICRIKEFTDLLI
jgi:D-amino peptidase